MVVLLPFSYTHPVMRLPHWMATWLLFAFAAGSLLASEGETSPTDLAEQIAENLLSELQPLSSEENVEKVVQKLLAPLADSTQLQEDLNWIFRNVLIWLPSGIRLGRGYSESAKVGERRKTTVYLEALDALMGRGAEPDWRLSNGGSHNLFEAAFWGKLAATKYLLDKAGIAPQLQDEETGRNAAHYAALKDQVEILKVLCNRGVPMTAKDNNGKIPLHYAAEKEALHCVKLLLEKSPEQASARDNQGKTPLHYAAAWVGSNTKKFIQCHKEKIITLLELLKTDDILEIEDYDGSKPGDYLPQEEYLAEFRALLAEVATPQVGSPEAQPLQAALPEADKDAGSEDNLSLAVPGPVADLAAEGGDGAGNEDNASLVAPVLRPAAELAAEGGDDAGNEDNASLVAPVLRLAADLAAEGGDDAGNEQVITASPLPSTKLTLPLGRLKLVVAAIVAVSLCLHYKKTKQRKTCTGPGSIARPRVRTR